MDEQRTTLCVIDDIKSLVNGIVNNIEWDQLRIRICGVAYNGQDGLEMIRQQKPDIIITDIRMPKLNGIDMIRQVIEWLPNSKIILITGYTDFEYAQQAVKLGAYDILTKPFSTDEITEVVLRAQEAMIHLHNEADRRMEMEQKLQESMPVLKQEYFNLLIRHSANDELARKRWDYLEIAMEPEEFSLFVLEIDQFSLHVEKQDVHELELIRFTMQNIIEETVNRHTKGIVFRENVNSYVVICNTTTSTNLGQLTEECRANIERYTKFTISIGVGNTVRYIHQLPEAFDQARVALSYHFYTEGNGVVTFSETTSEERIIPRFTSEHEQNLQLALKRGNREEAIYQLDVIFQGLIDEDMLPEPEYLVNLYHELSFFIFRTFMELIPYTDLASLQMEMQQYKPTTLRGYQESLHQLCTKGCDLISLLRRSDASALIESSIDYIKRNLHLDLSVNHCAAHVHLSGSYYSNLFKKTTGLSVNHFITNERVQKAQDMLTQGHQVQEIATALGYGERRSFSDVFKKYTGVTPSEFKESMEKREGGSR